MSSVQTHVESQPMPKVGEPLHSLMVSQIIDGVRVGEDALSVGEHAESLIRLSLGLGAFPTFISDRDLVQNHLGLGSISISVVLTPEIAQALKDHTFNDVGRLEIHAHGGVYAKYQKIIGSQLMLRFTNDQLIHFEEILIQRLKQQYPDCFAVRDMPCQRG